MPYRATDAEHTILQLRALAVLVQRGEDIGWRQDFSGIAPHGVSRFVAEVDGLKFARVIAELGRRGDARRYGLTPVFGSCASLR